MQNGGFETFSWAPTALIYYCLKMEECVCEDEKRLGGRRQEIQISGIVMNTF